MGFMAQKKEKSLLLGDLEKKTSWRRHTVRPECDFVESIILEAFNNK